MTFVYAQILERAGLLCQVILAQDYIALILNIQFLEMKLKKKEFALKWHFKKNYQKIKKNKNFSDKH